MFYRFCNESGYVPSADVQRGAGYLQRFNKLNFGAKDSSPVFGVTYFDALAFAQWHNYRIPSEEELFNFFLKSAAEQITFRWHGLCWTSTSSGDGYVLLDGPYRSLDGMQESNGSRVILAPSHFELLEAPCFRVVRD